MNSINKIRIVAVTLCLVCAGLIALPAAQGQTLSAAGGVNLKSTGYLFNVPDLQPSDFGLGFTNAALTDYVINLGQMVGHYADGVAITNALDLLPYVGQSLQITDTNGNTVVSLSDTGIYLHDDVTGDFFPITVTNGNLFFNGNLISEQAAASELTLLDQSEGAAAAVVTIDGGTLNVDGSPVNTDDQALSLSETTLMLEDGGDAIDLDTAFATDSELSTVSNTLSAAITDASGDDPASTDNVQFYYDFSETLEVNNERNGGVLGGIENLTPGTDPTLGAGYSYVAAEEDKLSRTITSTDTFTFYWSGFFEDAGSEHALLDNRSGRHIRLYKTSTDRLEVFMNDPATFIFGQAGPTLEMNTPYFITLRVRPNGANTDFAMSVNGVEYTSLNNTNTFDALDGTLHMNELQTALWPGTGFIAEVGLVNEWLSINEIARLETLYRAEEDPYDPATVVNTDNQLLALDGTTLSIDEGNSVDLSSIDTTIPDTDDQALSFSGTTLTLEDGGAGIDLGATFATDQEVADAISNVGGGDFLADGSVAMTGDLDMGGNNINNVHCIFLTDPSTGDTIKLEFVNGEFRVNDVPIETFTEKLQQAILSLAALDVNTDGSVDVSTLVSGGSGTGAYEYEIVDGGATLSGTTLSWTTATDVPFTLRARRLGDDNYYTSPWYEREYAESYSQVTKIEDPSPGTTEDSYGISVALDGDTLVIGSSASSSYNGRVFVFKRSESGWAIEAEIDGTSNSRFGERIAIHGDTFVATGSNALRIYERSGTTWSHVQDIGSFQSTVTLDFDGTTIVAGDEYADVAYTNSGAIYVYAHNGVSWTEQAVLNHNEPTEFYGSFPNAIAVDGDTIVGTLAAYSGSRGAGYVFERSGTTWTQTQRITAADASSGENFGYSDATIQGNTMVISSRADKYDGFTSAGSAYVFNHDGSEWTQSQKLVPSQAGSNYLVGESVSFEGNTIFVSAGNNAGYAGIVYTYDGSEWSEFAFVPDNDIVVNLSSPSSVIDPQTGSIIVGYLNSNDGEVLIYEP